MTKTRLPKEYIYCPPDYTIPHQWERTRAYIPVSDRYVRPEIKCKSCGRTFYGRPESRNYECGLARGIDDY